MINLELILATISFYFVMFVTPGPNNSILTASGIKFGFFRSIPNILGIPFGHGIQLILVVLGLDKLFDLFPNILLILKYIGAAYLLYLAWKIFGSLKVLDTSDKASPLKFYEAVLFQFVNPKAWIICVTAVPLFFPYEEDLIVGTFFMVFTSVAICLPSISLWAIGGSIIRFYLKDKKIKLFVEWILAILLAITALSITL